MRSAFQDPVSSDSIVLASGVSRSISRTIGVVKMFRAIVSRARMAGWRGSDVTGLSGARRAVFRAAPSVGALIHSGWIWRDTTSMFRCRPRAIPAIRSSILHSSDERCAGAGADARRAILLNSEQTGVALREAEEGLAPPRRELARCAAKQRSKPPRSAIPSAFLPC